MKDEKRIKELQKALAELKKPKKEYKIRQPRKKIKNKIPERYIYCKTCGNWDRAWFIGSHNKRKEKQKRWKQLTFKNKVYFGYRLIPCIQKRQHKFLTNLTKEQLIKRIKKGATDVRGLRSSGRRLSRIALPV